MFSLAAENAQGRRGTLQTDHGVIETPFFMPVGTAGAMRGLTHEHLTELGAQIMLCNTYHLHLSPGEDVVSHAGGLHQFIQWPKPILTDSGGYQVYSLRNKSIRDDSGVAFQAPDGTKRYLDPKSAMEIQFKLGADMIMCFDDCPPATSGQKRIEDAVSRTIRWAAECKEHHSRLCEETGRTPLLFGIVQGGLNADLRTHCAKELIALDFDGYAIGGLAVGESTEDMYRVLDTVCPLLPKDKPRYLMGVGHRNQMSRAIATGIDMFDCVQPTRLARHGHVLLADGTTMRIANVEYKSDFTPIDPASPIETSQVHSRAYLHHLCKVHERYGETLACMQNMAVTLQHLKDIRESIS